MGNFLFGAIVAVLGLAYVGGWDPANEAVGHIVDVQQLGDVGLVDEVLDAGVRVTTTIKNEGKEGFLHVRARLSSSEENGAVSRSSTSTVVNPKSWRGFSVNPRSTRPTFSLGWKSRLVSGRCKNQKERRFDLAGT